MNAILSLMLARVAVVLAPIFRLDAWSPAFAALSPLTKTILLSEVERAEQLSSAASAICVCPFVENRADQEFRCFLEDRQIVGITQLVTTRRACAGAPTCPMSRLRSASSSSNGSCPSPSGPSSPPTW